MFFCDDEDSWFFCELEVIDDGLSDADVVGRDDGCYFGKDSWHAGVYGDDFDDAPVHVGCDVFEMAGWCEVREYFEKLGFFFDDVSGCGDCSSIDLKCSGDF